MQAAMTASTPAMAAAIRRVLGGLHAQKMASGVDAMLLRLYEPLVFRSPPTPPLPPPLPTPPASPLSTHPHNTFPARPAALCSHNHPCFANSGCNDVRG